MWPPMLPLFPGMSRAALQYRTERLAAAEAIAADLGYPGAKYPLESAATGAEQMWTSAKYGWEELEETGCVAWALEQQLWQSGDEGWLRQSAPALLKIAQFFASRVVQCEPPRNTSLFCLNHVMGPDESHAPVNNSGFTSGIAAASVATGIRTATRTGAAVPSNWSQIAENIYLPFDDQLRYHPEFEGFRNGTVVRQADIQLLQYPLTYEFPPDVASNDMKLYEKSISGPAMTYGLFAVIYMQQHRQGDNFLELAQAEFNKSYSYLYGDYDSFSEGAGGGGTPHFATGMGAFLQSIVQGWAGVRYSHGALALRPQMPLDGTTNLTIAGIHFHASALTLSILPAHAHLALAAGPALRCAYTTPGNETAEKVLERGSAVLLQLGATATCRSQKEARAAKSDDGVGGDDSERNPCTTTPQPCTKEPGVTYCVSSNDQNQCTKPMPHPPCPPCPAPPPPLGVSFALAKSLGDGMVLQRAPGTARVWGFAPAGTTVVVTFKGKNLTATADSSKVWRQALPPQPASSVPTTITFASSDGGNASLRGVLFGDVHLCSGQSNSEFNVANLPSLPQG